MLRECSSCTLKDAEIKKKMGAIEALARKNTALNNIIIAIKENVTTADLETKRLREVVEENNKRLTESVPADQAREICRFAVSKGYAIQYIKNILFFTSLHRQLKGDAMQQWKKAVLPIDMFRKIEVRHQGLIMPEASEAHLNHLREEMVHTMKENQRLLDRVHELQALQRQASRRRVEQEDYIEIDEDDIVSAAFTWRSIIQYRQKFHIQACFQQWKGFSLEHRQVENGIRMPFSKPIGAPIQLDSIPSGSAFEETSFVQQKFDSMSMEDVKDSFAKKRAALRIITSLQQRRVTAMAEGFWGVWAVEPTFWASRLPYCHQCLSTHPHGKHTRFDLADRAQEEAMQWASGAYHGRTALAKVLSSQHDRDPFSGVHDGKLGGTDVTELWIPPYASTLPSFQHRGAV